MLLKFHHSTHSTPPKPCRTLYWWKCSELRGVAILKPHPFIHDLQKKWCFFNIHGGEFFSNFLQTVPFSNIKISNEKGDADGNWTFERCSGGLVSCLAGALGFPWIDGPLNVATFDRKRTWELRPLFLSRYLISTIISMHIISSCYSMW